MTSNNHEKYFEGRINYRHWIVDSIHLWKYRCLIFFCPLYSHLSSELVYVRQLHVLFCLVIDNSCRVWMCGCCDIGTCQMNCDHGTFSTWHISRLLAIVSTTKMGSMAEMKMSNSDWNITRLTSWFMMKYPPLATSDLTEIKFWTSQGMMCPLNDILINDVTYVTLWRIRRLHVWSDGQSVATRDFWASKMLSLSIGREFPLLKHKTSNVDSTFGRFNGISVDSPSERCVQIPPTVHPNNAFDDLSETQASVQRDGIEKTSKSRESRLVSALIDVTQWLITRERSLRNHGSLDGLPFSIGASDGYDYFDCLRLVE
jgi:hypothetical protein